MARGVRAYAPRTKPGLCPDCGKRGLGAIRWTTTGRPFRERRYRCAAVEIEGDA